MNHKFRCLVQPVPSHSKQSDSGAETSITRPLLDATAATFARTGMLVVRGLARAEQYGGIRDLARDHLQPLLGPAEYEADVQYPGAPASRIADGGHTPRRLLNAVIRDALLRDWATSPQLGDIVAQLLGTNLLCVSQSHHNCIMTKYPGFSSSTGWHQDIRYWSFDRPELVSAWLALGDEYPENGGLRLIPGSHLMGIDRGRLDADLFLREDLAVNRQLIDQAETVHLCAGDVLLFHSNLFHAAGMNVSENVKLSAVFTYHAADNQPIPDTRSAMHPSLSVSTSLTPPRGKVIEGGSS